MSYQVVLSKRAQKELDKLDDYTYQMLFNWINKNLVNCKNPRVTGKALRGNRKDQWRYRVGDYRILCFINDSELIILAIHIGHRKEVYKL